MGVMDNQVGFFPFTKCHISSIWTMPLRFDTLEQALAYVAQTPGTLRIMEVGDEGERLPVDTGAL